MEVEALSPRSLKNTSSATSSKKPTNPLNKLINKNKDLPSNPTSPSNENSENSKSFCDYDNHYRNEDTFKASVSLLRKLRPKKVATEPVLSPEGEITPITPKAKLRSSFRPRKNEPNMFPQSLQETSTTTGADKLKRNSDKTSSKTKPKIDTKTPRFEVKTLSPSRFALATLSPRGRPAADSDPFEFASDKSKKINSVTNVPLDDLSLKNTTITLPPLRSADEPLPDRPRNGYNQVSNPSFKRHMTADRSSFEDSIPQLPIPEKVRARSVRQSILVADTTAQGLGSEEQQPKFMRASSVSTTSTTKSSLSRRPTPMNLNVADKSISSTPALTILTSEANSIHPSMRKRSNSDFSALLLKHNNASAFEKTSEDVQNFLVATPRARANDNVMCLPSPGFTSRRANNDPFFADPSPVATPRRANIGLVFRDVPSSVDEPSIKTTGSTIFKVYTPTATTPRAEPREVENNADKEFAKIMQSVQEAQESTSRAFTNSNSLYDMMDAIYSEDVEADIF